MIHVTITLIGNLEMHLIFNKILFETLSSKSLENSDSHSLGNYTR